MAGDSLLFLLSLGVSETLLVERTHPLDGPQAVRGPRQGRTGPPSRPLPHRGSKARFLSAMVLFLWSLDVLIKTIVDVQVYNIVVQQSCTLVTAHHGKCSYPLSPYKVTAI